MATTIQKLMAVAAVVLGFAWQASPASANLIAADSYLVGSDPANGRYSKFDTDPHWKDLVLFYEYFDGDNGAGLGASHQTGWTGLIAKLIQQHAEYAQQDPTGRQFFDEQHFTFKPKK